jgi:NTE family protein
MSTAFVLSGGGSLGSVQVGMLLALAERGIEPDLLVGTSVGAINAAWVAGDPGLDGARRLAQIWRSVRRGNVFPVRPIPGLLGLVGRSDHIVSPGPLRALLKRNLAYRNLEDARVPVKVVATDITTGLEYVIDHGDAVEAIAASAAIPGVFPPVVIDDHHLVDGGASDNTPVSQVIDSGASEIYVLPTGYSCTLKRAPKSALGVAIQAITLLVQERLLRDVERYQGQARITVLPPLCPLDVSPIDFSRTAELIDAARQSSGRWLDKPHVPGEQAAVLSLHDHR